MFFSLLLIRYLFCDFNHGIAHCVAKIKLGGNCRGFEGMDACFNGQCLFGRCQPGPTPPVRDQSLTIIKFSGINPRD